MTKNYPIQNVNSAKIEKLKLYESFNYSSNEHNCGDICSVPGIVVEVWSPPHCPGAHSYIMLLFRAHRAFRHILLDSTHVKENQNI